MPVERRLAVIDLGSNSFRLVVFTHTEDWWKRTDEIYEPVRVGEHQEPDGPLQPEPMERALEAIELFAHFCRATGIKRVRPLATNCFLFDWRIIQSPFSDVAAQCAGILAGN